MTYIRSCLLAVLHKVLLQLLAVCVPVCALVFPIPPSLPLGGGLGKYWVGKYSTELFSVTVPGGGRSQGCHGYLLLMLERCPAPPTL